MSQDRVFLEPQYVALRRYCCMARFGMHVIIVSLGGLAEKFLAHRTMRPPRVSEEGVGLLGGHTDADDGSILFDTCITEKMFFVASSAVGGDAGQRVGEVVVNDLWKASAPFEDVLMQPVSFCLSLSVSLCLSLSVSLSLCLFSLSVSLSVKSCTDLSPLHLFTLASLVLRLVVRI